MAHVPRAVFVAAKRAARQQLLFNLVLEHGLGAEALRALHCGLAPPTSYDLGGPYVLVEDAFELVSLELADGLCPAHLARRALAAVHVLLVAVARGGPLPPCVVLMCLTERLAVCAHDRGQVVSQGLRAALVLGVNRDPSVLRVLIRGAVQRGVSLCVWRKAEVVHHIG